jgi:hypothetical protein
MIDDDDDDDNDDDDDDDDDDNDDKCGTIGGMRIGRENLSTRTKPNPVPLRPPQIPHDPTRSLSRTAAVEKRRLTARAMTRPTSYYSGNNKNGNGEDIT